jgi:hypothetical protein
MSSTATRYTECLTASWLAERLAVDPARVDAMRRAGELVAVRDEGSTEWLYPAWNLDGGQPRPSIARIVAAAREAQIDDAALYDALVAPRGLRGDQRLVDLLVAGREEDVIRALRGSR